MNFVPREKEREEERESERENESGNAREEVGERENNI